MGEHFKSKRDLMPSKRQAAQKKRLIESRVKKPSVKEPVTKLITVRLSKMAHPFKRKDRARKCIMGVQKLLAEQLCTKTIKIDQSLNNLIWSQGRKNVPAKIRVKADRRMNEDNQMVTYCSAVHVPTFKELLTENE